MSCGSIVDEGTRLQDAALINAKKAEEYITVLGRHWLAPLEFLNASSPTRAGGGYMTPLVSGQVRSPFEAGGCWRSS